jgi:hypothetical protein
MPGGGLMQLVAYGAQYVYLAGNPQIGNGYSSNNHYQVHINKNTKRPYIDKKVTKIGSEEYMNFEFIHK